jgi:hypothetical protein
MTISARRRVLHRRPLSHILRLTAAGAGMSLLAVVAAPAAEVSAADTHPPGVTIGVPAGAAPPAGFYLQLRPSYYDADMVDSHGHDNGTHLKTASLTPTLIWSTGWQLLGASHYMIVNQPIVNVDARGPQVSSDHTGLFNTYVSPLVLSWMVAPGIFVSTGSGAYLPTASGGVGNNFWSYEQQFGFGFLRGGWNLSLNAVYDINAANHRTHYRTGDRFYADFTATKKFGNWEIGPVGYAVFQTTADRNSGMAYGPYRPTFGKVKRVAAGGYIGYDFGPVSLAGYVTGEVYARNGMSGLRGWLGVSVPFVSE